MKKTFQLRPEGKNPDRVLEAIKHDIRKYLTRERNKALPQGADYWDFDCRFGSDADHAQTVHTSALRDCINAAAADGASHFYLEIIARPAQRQARADQAATEEDDDTLPE